MSSPRPASQDGAGPSSPIRPHFSTLPFCIMALAYSGLLFFIANYLPLLTNAAAQELTWVVYSRIIKGIVIFMAAVLGFIAFIRWPLVQRRRLFLLQLVPFAALTVWFFGRLGDSVNEYIHYPQYACCALLWFTALNRLERQWREKTGLLASLLRKPGPLSLTLIISAVLGIAEEGYQYIAPRRAFDFQDIALNLMGVWLGAMIVWIMHDSLSNVKPPSVAGNRNKVLN